ncbi:SLBB domain-containing protein [Agarivorans sp. QJM3NY_33]|uniref:SLBB domain-containing protein n=1 Tax=Agarivorans sp. QJM3NY_33 TaxID=3421432 RepID=UPI003D7E3CF2
MKFGLRSLIAICLLACSQNVFAVNVSPEQMQMLKTLPAEQQAALAKQYGVDVSQLNSSNGIEDEALAAPKLSEKRNSEEAAEQNIAKKNSAGQVEELQRFGLDVFATQPATFAPLSNVPVTDNYRLGPGDTLVVQLFGKENNKFEFRVNRYGSISFPELGPVNIAGLTFSEAKDLLSQTISEKKIGVRSSITMGELRSIEVFVLGEAYQPGKYLVSSLSTMTHALYASGGVNGKGSLRDIRLLRDGKLVNRLDVYDLLINGDTSDDLQLRSGDVIFIAPLGPTASIDGEVVRPAIYELNDHETVKDLVSMAGGYTTKAYKNSVSFERITNDGLIDLNTLDLNNQTDLAKRLKNGDFLKVEAIVKHTKNYIAVKGNVVREGRYQWRAGIKVSDLFPSIHRSLYQSSDLNYALVVRRNPDQTIKVLQINLGQAITNKQSQDNIQLNAEDEILVFTKHDLAKFDEAFAVVTKDKDVLSVDAAEMNAKVEETEQQQNKTVGDIQGDEEYNFERASELTRIPVEQIKKAFASTREKLLAPVLTLLQSQSSLGDDAHLVEIFGEVKFPGVYPITDKNTIRDLITAAGGLNNGAYAEHSELSRTVVRDGQAQVNVLRLNLNDALQNNPEDNLVLKSRDRLNVLAIPNLRKQRTVNIQGEVRFPGTYVIKRGETLGAVIKRAGGLTDYAHEDGAVFTREALRLREQKQIDAYAETIRQEVAKKSLRQRSPSSFSASAPPSEQLALIEEMSTTKALGRMVVDLPAILNNDASKDFMLEDQDLLYVPQYRNTVTIMGEVQISTSYLLDEKYTYKDYINFAGGTKKQADEDRVFVVKANGAVYKPESGFWFKNNSQDLQPGDTIVVPIDTDYRDALSMWTAVTQIMYQIGVAVNVLK